MASMAQELAALRATVQAWREEDKRDREEARTSREAMARDIEDIKAEASATRNRLDAVASTATEAKNVTDQVKGWRAIFTGIVLTLGMLGAAFLVFKDHLASFVRHVITGA